MIVWIRRLLTSSARAVGTIAVRAFDADADDFTVNVDGVVCVEVAGTAATVRNLRSSHPDVLSNWLVSF